MKLGNNIKKFREARGGISQEGLAAVVGVSRQTIISLEKGKYVPNTLLSLKIAKFFDTRVEDVFYLVDDNKNRIRWRVKWE